jgi:hypothetical protein
MRERLRIVEAAVQNQVTKIIKSLYEKGFAPAALCHQLLPATQSR